MSPHRIRDVVVIAGFALVVPLAALAAGTALRTLREAPAALASPTPSPTPLPSDPDKGITPTPSPPCVSWIPPETPHPLPPQVQLVGPRHAVEGTVTAGAAPLPSARIAVYQGGYSSTASVYPEIAEAHADASGRFTLSLVSGTYRLLITPPSTVVDYLGVWVGGSTRGFGTATDVAIANADVHLGAIALPRVTTLAGRVTGTDGVPVAGASVRISDAALSRANSVDAAIAKTRADGTYRVHVLPGTYRVSAEPARGSGYRVAWHGGAADWCTAANVTVDAIGRSGINVVTPRGPIISGIVRGAGGATLQNIVLIFYRVDPPAGPGEATAVNARTDRLGRYAVNASDGRYRLEVQDPTEYGYDGGVDLSQRDVVVRGDRRLELTLRPALSHVKVSRDDVLALARSHAEIARLERIDARLQELGRLQRIGGVTWPGAGERQRAWAVAVSGDFTSGTPPGPRWIVLLYDPNTGAALPWSLRGTTAWPAAFGLADDAADYYAESPGPFEPVPISVAGVVREFVPAPEFARTESERGVITVGGHRYYLADGTAASASWKTRVAVGSPVLLSGRMDERGELIEYGATALPSALCGVVTRYFPATSTSLGSVTLGNAEGDVIRYLVAKGAALPSTLRGSHCFAIEVRGWDAIISNEIPAASAPVHWTRSDHPGHQTDASNFSGSHRRPSSLGPAM